MSPQTALSTVRKPRLAVSYKSTFYGAEDTVRSKVTSLLGVASSCVSYANGRTTLEFDIPDPHTKIALVRQQTPVDVDVWVQHQNNYHYSAAATTPKRQLRVTTKSGKIVFTHITYVDDVLKEVTWVRDHGVFSSQVSAQDIAKIEIVSDAASTT